MRGVVTLAGDGSRMLPWTQGLRKEFLPVFDRPTRRGDPPVLKPVAHCVIETLVGAGVHDITLVVRPENRGLVASYFRSDTGLLARHQHHPERLRETLRFYRDLARLRLSFQDQREPRGFGDAVLRGAPASGNEPFVVHAGDAILVEKHRGAVVRAMIRLREKEGLDAVLLVRRVADPSRYGVVDGRAARPFGGFRRLEVRQMAEKPARPRSSWAATAVYAFGPRILPALRNVARSRPRELELTAGIAELLGRDGSVGALVLTAAEGEWRSVGSPEGYLRAVLRTRALASG